MNVCITYRFLNLQWNGKLLVTLFNEGTKNAVQRNRRPTGILWQPKSRDIFAASYCELKYSLRIWSDGTGSLYTSLLTVSRSGLFCLLWRKRPQPTPIQWDLEDRYSTSNHNFSLFYIPFCPHAPLVSKLTAYITENNNIVCPEVIGGRMMEVMGSLGG